MISAEVAVYPLKIDNASKVITDSINPLRNSNIDYKVNSMNTHLSGSKEQVFKCLEDMFTEAEKSGGEISMVVTIGNANK